MKFMLMMSGTQAGCEVMTRWAPQEVRSHIEFMIAFAKDLEASGELVLAEGLDFPFKPKIVKAGPGGKAVVTDGPFPETKEFLAGFWIVDVETPERAIEIAAAASAAPGQGGKPMAIPIEVRQVISAPEV